MPAAVESATVETAAMHAAATTAVHGVRRRCGERERGNGGGCRS
jgi:hypothetical protein